MHVIWHHYPGAEFVEVPLDIPDHDGAGYNICDSRVLEPLWPWTVAIQSTVSNYERVASTGVRLGRRNRLPHQGRQCSPQAPS